MENVRYWKNILYIANIGFKYTTQKKQTYNACSISHDFETLARYSVLKISICRSIYLSVFLFVYLSIYFSLSISIYLSTYLSISLSLYLSTYLFRSHHICQLNGEERQNICQESCQNRYRIWCRMMWQSRLPRWENQSKYKQFYTCGFSKYGNVVMI